MICEIKNYGKNYILIYVDGEFKWFCKNLKEVEEQIKHNFEMGFFDKNTKIINK